MNRPISTILIPMLLVSQSLFSVPHSHAGSSVVEPDGHADRPHIHLHQHAHDDHQHGPGEREPESDQAPVNHGPEHDSDAFFAGDSQLLNDGSTAEIPESTLTAVCQPSDDTASVTATRRFTGWTSTGPLRPKSALYLQLLSIRC
jgi:hypothetical protein